MSELERLISQLASDPAGVEAAPHPYRLALTWTGAAAAYLAAALLVSGVRPDLAQALARPWFVAELAALLLIFLATSLSAALLAFPDLYQKRGVALAPLWAFALFLGVLLLSWLADDPPAALPAHSLQCSACIVLLALLPAAWIFYTMRKFASAHYLWAGSAAMLAAFSVGALWLRLQEANDSIAHVIEWHYLPMLAFGLCGMLLGKALLRW